MKFIETSKCFALSFTLMLTGTSQSLHAQAWDCPTRPSQYQLTEITAPTVSPGQTVEYINPIDLNNAGQVLLKVNYSDQTEALVRWKLGTSPVLVAHTQAGEFLNAEGLSDVGDILFQKFIMKESELVEIQDLMFSNALGVRPLKQVYPKLDLSEAYLQSLQSDGNVFFEAEASVNGEVEYHTQTVNKAGSVGALLPNSFLGEFLSYSTFGVGSRAVGYFTNPNTFEDEFAQYIPSSNSLVQIPRLTNGGPILFTSGINDKDYVLGAAEHSTGTSRAFLWKNGTAIRNIGVLSGDVESFGDGINTNNEVIGSSYDSEYNSTAFIWTRCQGLRSLDSKRPAGFSQSITGAYRINNAGQMVVQDDEGRFLFMKP